MEINSNYSITKLFVSKTLKLSIDNQQFFTLKLKTLRDMYEDADWNSAYHIWTTDASKLKKTLMIAEDQDITSFDVVKVILLRLGQYDKFRKIYTLFKKELEEILPEFQVKNNNLMINDITMTTEIWEYIIYLLKLSYGEKVEKPLNFSSEEARQFYLAQKANDEKIKALRSKQEGDVDGLMKIMLSITYAFPSLTFDYLFDQTMAQIQWLQKYAAGSVSYEVNAKAFAAGNVKKGKKLDFFIK